MKEEQPVEDDSLQTDDEEQDSLVRLASDNLEAAKSEKATDVIKAESTGSKKVHEVKAPEIEAAA